MPPLEPRRPNPNIYYSESIAAAGMGMSLDIFRRDAGHLLEVSPWREDREAEISEPNLTEFARAHYRAKADEAARNAAWDGYIHETSHARAAFVDDARTKARERSLKSRQKTWSTFGPSYHAGAELGPSPEDMARAREAGDQAAQEAGERYDAKHRLLDRAEFERKAAKR